MDSPRLPERRCGQCSAAARSPLAWRCACGGAFEYDWTPRFDPGAVRRAVWSQSRYDDTLLPPGIPGAARTSLGEGATPIATIPWDGAPVTFKLEMQNPTGSHKDRGSATLVSVLRAEGHLRVIEDSSGNAGASIAAYAASAGIEATVFVPSHASPAKKAQIRAYGAEVREIAGPRSAAGEACRALADATLYASHAFHPAALLGQMAAAWELWEQTNGHLPDAVVLPVGQGGMLLGYHRGFRALADAGAIHAVPRLVAVQSAACAPIERAFARGDDVVEPVEERPTLAEGIRTHAPARGAAVLRALRESGGLAVTVEDGAIRSAQGALARRGLFVESTSAAPVAALPEVRARLGKQITVCIPLSGSGLKGS